MVGIQFSISNERNLSSLFFLFSVFVRSFFPQQGIVCLHVFSTKHTHKEEEEEEEEETEEEKKRNRRRKEKRREKREAAA